MKLIQKNCPNCVASLQIKQEDKEVRCEYCKQLFIIDDEVKKDNTIVNIDPEVVEKGIKIFGISWAIGTIIPLIFFIFIIGIFVFIIIMFNMH